MEWHFNLCKLARSKILAAGANREEGNAKGRKKEEGNAQVASIAGKIVE